MFIVCRCKTGRLGCLVHGATVEPIDNVKNDRRRQWVSMCLVNGGHCISLTHGTAEKALAALDKWCKGKHVMFHDLPARRGGQ